jgi:hypothetical protein
VKTTLSLDRVRGCLLGGAVGDALGGAVEFDSLAQIRSEHGANGIVDYANAYGRHRAITDDTQMTLFSAEGLIRAATHGALDDRASTVAVLHHAYLRWLLTQTGQWGGSRDVDAQFSDQPDGWLVNEQVLHHRRAPGTTRLSALSSGRLGTPAQPVNDSRAAAMSRRFETRASVTWPCSSTARYTYRDTPATLT